MKICFLAPSGYGKSTAIEILKKHFDVENIKLAEPLYELQKAFYDKLGIDIGDKQDGELLQFLGKKVRKEHATFLLDEFDKKLEKASATIISNDDCRPDDYQHLKEQGFIFVKINGFKRERDDVTQADSKAKIEWQSEIPFDYEIDNTGTKEEYEEKILNLMNKLLVPKCYVVPIQKACNCDCTFCISKTRIYDKEESVLKLDDRFIENIYRLKKHGVTRFEITGGGEPFLNPDLDKIVLAIKRIIPNSYIKLYTNGNILRRIEGIDEIDISVVSDNTDINNQFMKGNNISLQEKLEFFKRDNVKLRLSVALIKGAIDTKEKLDGFIDRTKGYVDEYVVRTLYPNTPQLEQLYVDFDYEHEKVVMEKSNDVGEFEGIILWSDNKFYRNWSLDTKKHFHSYLLLKPDSKTYINEIMELIKAKGFDVLKVLRINDFKEKALELYKEKDSDYQEIVKRHLAAITHLFGNNGLVLYLDKEGTMEEIYYATLKLKEEIRNKCAFTQAYGGYVEKDGNISHVNLVHCPDANGNLFNRDLDYIEEIEPEEINSEAFTLAKKYGSYNI